MFTPQTCPSSHGTLRGLSPGHQSRSAERCDASLRCLPVGLKEWQGKVDLECVGEQKIFTDDFHAKVNVSSALILSAVAFGVWMVGVWMSDLHTSLRVVHVLGAVVAIAGAITTFFCAWLALRAWQVQHRQ